jgi:hypothetical protein
MQVAHRHAAAADRMVQKELELRDRHTGLERERRVQVPQRVPDEVTERVGADLGDVPARAVRREQPGRIGVGDPVLLDPAAHEVRQGARQGQVERALLAPLGLGTLRQPRSWSKCSILASTDAVSRRAVCVRARPLRRAATWWRRDRVVLRFFSLARARARATKKSKCVSVR